MFYFSEKVKKSSSAAFKEALTLEILKTIDPREEICSLSKYSNCRNYLQQILKITLPTILHNEELKEKLEEFDCLIEIYKRQQETQKAREFEESLIIHQKD